MYLVCFPGLYMHMVRQRSKFYQKSKTSWINWVLDWSILINLKWKIHNLNLAKTSSLITSPTRGPKFPQMTFLHNKWPPQRWQCRMQTPAKSLPKTKSTTSRKSSTYLTESSKAKSTLRTLKLSWAACNGTLPRLESSLRMSTLTPLASSLSTNLLIWCSRWKTVLSSKEIQTRASRSPTTSSYNKLCPGEDLLTFKQTQKCSTSCVCLRNTAANAKSKAIMQKLAKVVPSLKSFFARKLNVRKTISARPKSRNCKTLRQHKRLNFWNLARLGTTIWVIMRLLPTSV